MATPVPPPGWVEPPATPATDAQRARTLERRLDELQATLEPWLHFPWLDSPDGRYRFFCGEIDEYADDCEVLCPARAHRLPTRIADIVPVRTDQAARRTFASSERRRIWARASCSIRSR